MAGALTPLLVAAAIGVGFASLVFHWINRWTGSAAAFAVSGFLSLFGRASLIAGMVLWLWGFFERTAIAQPATWQEGLAETVVLFPAVFIGFVAVWQTIVLGLLVHTNLFGADKAGATRAAR